MEDEDERKSHRKESDEAELDHQFQILLYQSAGGEAVQIVILFPLRNARCGFVCRTATFQRTTHREEKFHDVIDDLVSQHN